MSKSQDASLHGAIARCGKLLGLGALASLLVLSAAHAQTKGATPTPDDRGLRLVTLAPIPAASNNSTGGALYSFDISYVDPSTGNYFLADRSNRVVDFVDSIGRYVTGIPANPAFAGFTGSNATSGPNGVVAAFPWLFVTDANSRVVTIDLRNNSTVSNASTGGAPGLRADELAYDPTHGVLLVVNNADTPPFATFVIVNQSTGHLTVSARITFDAAHGVDAQNGAEQPVWDGTLNRFFLTIPQIGSNVQNGGVVRINPFSASVEATYPVQFCGPAGLTLGPNQNLFIGCNMVFDTNGNVWDPNGAVPADPRDVIINANNGAILATVRGVGAGDEVWFNPGTGNYYATGSGSPERPLSGNGSTPAGVVDASFGILSQRFPTYNVAAVTTPTTGHPAHPAGTSHSIAASSINNLVFVPLPANNAVLSPDATKNCLTGCVAVFKHGEE
jgi:hypothetical protein